MARSRWLRVAGILGVAVVGFAVTAALTVSHFEEQDPFCASCHTAPEVTYFQRAQQATTDGSPYDDLSSAHYGQDAGFRCIDCHRGDEGPVDRVTALSLGARDTAIWISGTADPTIEKTELVVPHLLTNSCTKCHADSLLEVGFNNHFHNRLPDAYRAWRAGGELRQPASGPALPAGSLKLDPVATDVLCVDCHRAHIHVPGSELQAYLDVVNTVYPACVRCHREAGHGPLDLAG
jgi:hypothetical protein